MLKLRHLIYLVVAVLVIFSANGAAALTYEGTIGGGSGGAVGTSSLDAPSGLTATVQGTGQIDLSWNVVTGADGYKVYRDGELVVTQSGTTHTNTSGLSAGTTYAYKVKAYNNLVESSFSAEVTARTNDAAATGGGGGGGDEGGGGGGGSTTTITTTTTTSTLSVEAKKVDANNDNKIDVLDFNTLIVNWGTTGGADFNQDGTVDVFDFNLLMINWSV